MRKRIYKTLGTILFIYLTIYSFKSIQLYIYLSFIYSFIYLSICIRDLKGKIVDKLMYIPNDYTQIIPSLDYNSRL